MGMPCREPHEPTQEMCVVVTQHSEFKSGWWTQTLMTCVSHQWYWLCYCSLILAPGILKIQSALESVNKNDSIDEARELCIYEACTAETGLRMLIVAATGAVISELTLMLVPDFVSRLHWLDHYMIWSPQVGVPQCPCGSVWTYSPPGMLSLSCDVRTNSYAPCQL